MARIEWVKTRLDNWARWQCSQQANGLGFATQAAFLNEHPGTDRQVRIPIDEIEASVTHELVESFKAERPQLHAVLWCMYPFGLGVLGTCSRLGCERSNVYALLDVADRELARLFAERDRLRAERREAIKKSFTT